VSCYRHTAVKPASDGETAMQGLRAFSWCTMAMAASKASLISRTLFEVAPRQGFRENSNFNFAASGA